MNASSIEDATEIDYFITNVKPSKVTPEWIVNTHIPHNRIVLWEVTRQYLFNLRIIAYSL